MVPPASWSRWVKREHGRARLLVLQTAPMPWLPPQLYAASDAPYATGPERKQRAGKAGRSGQQQARTPDIDRRRRTAPLTSPPHGRRSEARRGGKECITASK